MSQQPPPTPHPSFNRWSSLGLWIGFVLLLITTILGIYAIVTKQALLTYFNLVTIKLYLVIA